mmetsp:Transcript_2822/g.2957  ORF Transcript_2822/g.2957 Transcript_2822/m.2957 type:complete len:173 (+) Transcript_2822:377-895(+)
MGSTGSEGIGLCLALIVFIVGLLPFAVAEHANKLFSGRTQRHVKLKGNTGLNGVRGSNVSGNERSSSSGSESTKFMKAATRPLFNIKLAATSVKDEVTDIFDSIVFAESGAERIENTLSVIRRHKLLLAGGTLALVLKTTYGGKRAKDIGRDVMDDLRRKEIEKWGARAAKA